LAQIGLSAERSTGATVDVLDGAKAEIPRSRKASQISVS
jgi:hypothetical protein